MNRHKRSGGISVKTQTSERGAALVEYILLLSLVLLVALAGVLAFGTTTGDNIDDSADQGVAANARNYGG
jgi:Flp pilus assembly pilin Flp